VLIPAVAAMLSSGCSFLLPTSQDAAKSKWTSYNEAKAAFDQVIPGATPTNELVALGFHPSINPNGRILTYLDVIPRFLPNGAISRDDLDPAVRAFIEGGEDGEAWEVVLNRAKSKRHGSAILDLTGFVKKTHETGWRFKGLFLIQNGRVVYKLASGTPNVAIDEVRKRPLGPFQELDDIIVRSDDREKRR
jgi:hypothetical protein